MSTKSDLIAAKALIDTPEKWEAMPVRIALFEAAEGSAQRYQAMDSALRLVDGPRSTHPYVMVMFDRAIAAAEVSP